MFEFRCLRQLRQSDMKLSGIDISEHDVASMIYVNVNFFAPNRPQACRNTRWPRPVGRVKLFDMRYKGVLHHLSWARAISASRL